MHTLTVIFDLDGTLVETAPDLVGATTHALATVGLAPILASELRPKISSGARAMIEHGLRFHDRAVMDEEFELLLERFFAYYADNIANASHAYAGVESALAR